MVVSVSLRITRKDIKERIPPNGRKLYRPFECLISHALERAGYKNVVMSMVAVYLRTGERVEYPKKLVHWIRDYQNTVANNSTFDGPGINFSLDLPTLSVSPRRN